MLCEPWEDQIQIIEDQLKSDSEFMSPCLGMLFYIHGVLCTNGNVPQSVEYGVIFKTSEHRLFYGKFIILYIWPIYVLTFLLLDQIYLPFFYLSKFILVTILFNYDKKVFFMTSSRRYS